MKKIIAIAALLVSAVALSQVNPKMALGNQEYSAKDYAKAEAHYRESAATAKDGKAMVNMGNAIYREKNMSEAGATYLKALQKAKTFDEKHRAYHNLGNVMMQAKDYQAAVDAYQNALRNNPNDEQTRYNYALARQYLKDNPPPKDKGDDKDKKKQPKEQEQKQISPSPMMATTKTKKRSQSLIQRVIQSPEAVCQNSGCRESWKP